MSNICKDCLKEDVCGKKQDLDIAEGYISSYEDLVEIKCKRKIVTSIVYKDREVQVPANPWPYYPTVIYSDKTGGIEDAD